jgi:hypothetical protein
MCIRAAVAKLKKTPSFSEKKLLYSYVDTDTTHTVETAVNLQLNPNVTTIMSGHGNIRCYLHRLKIIDSSECPCKKDIQTIGYLIFQCEKLKYERGIMKNGVLKAGNWPISKSELVNKNINNSFDI